MHEPKCLIRGLGLRDYCIAKLCRIVNIKPTAPISCQFPPKASLSKEVEMGFKRLRICPKP